MKTALKAAGVVASSALTAIIAVRVTAPTAPTAPPPVERRFSATVDTGGGSDGHTNPNNKQHEVFDGDMEMPPGTVCSLVKTNRGRTASCTLTSGVMVDCDSGSDDRTWGCHSMKGTK